MKKTITLIATVLIFIVLISATRYKSSTAAPASHTGAPDEKTCTESGCHDDNKINKGSANLSIEIGDKTAKYIAGQTYSIKIKIEDENVSRFGFQVVALSTETNKNIGKFTITDKERTQIVNNAYKLEDRQYVTYTFNGTDAVKKGLGEWTVNWTAPSTTNEAVVFYVAAVSGNDDMTDKGDFVYTNKLKLK